MNNAYLVSVITPAFNATKTIAETIESVLKQTYSNFEMIIVDDCSSDDTVEIITSYTLKDSRVKLVEHRQNQGTAAARNTAISVSKGRFIAFLDADDTWNPQKLDKQIEFMLLNKYGFTFTEYEVMNDESVMSGRVFRVPPKIDYKGYLKNTTIGLLTVVMDREYINNIYVQEGYLEDVLTWMYYLKSGVVAYGIDENLASYRVFKGSKSSNKIKNAKRYFVCLRKSQKLPFCKCVYYQFWYMFNAVKKRLG